MNTPNMGQRRLLTDYEVQLILRLIELLGESQVRFSPEDFEARDYTDNVPGSFLLSESDRSCGEIQFGRELVRGEFEDSDGISASVALNLNQNDCPFEVDIWKVDDTEILRWPDLSAIRVIDSFDASLH